MNRTEYKNQHAKEHYDRINFKIPKGEKERIKAAVSRMGMCVNEYLFALVCDDLASGESRFGKKKQGFDEEQRRMLEKWQVPGKYHEQKNHPKTLTKCKGGFFYLYSFGQPALWAVVFYTYNIP